MEQQVLCKAKSIIDHSDHILTQEFSLMSTGRRHLTPVKKTNRSNSFIPAAVRLLNSVEAATEDCVQLCSCRLQ